MKTKKILICLLTIILICSGCSNSTKNNSDDGLISYIEAKEKIINNGAILIDVRTKEEYDEKHIDGAVLLTLDDIDEDSAKNVITSKDSIVIVYCKSGVRSSEASKKLADLGYTKVYNLGAMSNWEE